MRFPYSLVTVPNLLRLWLWLWQSEGRCFQHRKAVDAGVCQLVIVRGVGFVVVDVVVQLIGGTTSLCTITDGGSHGSKQCIDIPENQ